MQFSSLADLVKHFESSGGTDCSPSPTGAEGCYQIVGSTWRTYAPQAGVDTSLYPTAGTAPQSVQDRVFSTMVGQRGLADYTCPGCNAPLTSYVNANPYVASLPIFSDASASSTGAGGDTLTIDPNYSTTPSYPPGAVDPATGFPYTDFAGGQTGAGGLDIGPFTSAEGLFGPSAPFPVPGTTAGQPASQGGLAAIAAWSWDKLSRFGLILLGALLLVVAAWGMVRGENPAEAVRSLAKAGG